MTIFVVVVAVAAGTGFRRGSMLSPFVLVLLTLLSIFGIRPLLMPAQPESFNFYGYNTTAGFEAAALMGFVGTLSFVMGYAFRRLTLSRRRAAGMIELASPWEIPPEWAPGRSMRIAWGLFGGWFLMMIVIGGGVGFLAEIFGGRSPEVMANLAGVPAVVSALPVIGCLTIAVVRFRHERYLRYSSVQNFSYWLIAALSVVPPSAIGTRRFLIPSLLMAVLGALANSWHSRIKPSWVIGGVVGFFALAIVPFIRSSGSRAPGTDLLGAMRAYFGEQGVGGILDGFFLSYDTEMFNYVSYLSQSMGTRIEFGFGRGTVGEVLALPIPAALSPFERWNDVLLLQMFGTVCDYQQACPVPSIIGVLYSDFAWAGVIGGMVLLGIWSARFEGSLITATGTRLGALLLAAGWTILFTRGNSMAQVWLAFQVFVVWWVLDRFLLRPTRGASATHEPAPPNRTQSRV
ncbi:hypothetical protein [Agromyces sp. NDB4Y10]|uniref:hypothetical protein n=1 Tax=Agromyces sp. NDB4Y10 TaxID=1775951 RepID=UPI0012F93BA5|nr:hypothetical protein [Agromyces sp. NDB4Y10]